MSHLATKYQLFIRCKIHINLYIVTIHFEFLVCNIASNSRRFLRTLLLLHFKPLVAEWIQNHPDFSVGSLANILPQPCEWVILPLQHCLHALPSLAVSCLGSPATSFCKLLAWCNLSRSF